MDVSARTVFRVSFIAGLMSILAPVAAGPVSGALATPGIGDRPVGRWVAQEPRDFSPEDIAADSEFGYVQGLHDETSEGVNIIKCTVVCKDGVVTSRVRFASHDGRIDSISHPKASLDAYLRLWRVLEARAAMALESSDALLMRSKTPEDGPYERFETSHDWHRFAFRIKDRKHVFDIYGIDLLKDKRYRAILDEIDRFLGMKSVGRKPLAVTTIIY